MDIAPRRAVLGSSTTPRRGWARAVWAALGALASALVSPAIALADSPPGDDPSFGFRPRAGGAGDLPSATFALIVGVNASGAPGAPSLRYADDDAARYLELFESIGARAYVLTRLDENTRRLHPRVAATARLPVRSEFDRAVAALARDVGDAHRRQQKTLVYFVYAGHGSVKDGRGYLTLEDAQLDAGALDRDVVDGIQADLTHFIVDACDSYFLAMARGPGGERREARGFARTVGLRPRDSVGLLLSTSSARESHEWSGFQAGIFSHEVRSALYGAADADGDGRVSYKEISAFIERANEAIPNEQYRPTVYARPPKETPVLVDLRAPLHSRVDLTGAHASHYFLEDSRGVRIADFHNEVGQPVELVRPAQPGQLYLRRLIDDAEFVLPQAPEVVEVARLSPAEPRDRTRGAANDAFEQLFALPFGRRIVDAFVLRPLPADAPATPARDATAPWRWGGGICLLGLGAAGAATGVLTLVSAERLKSGVTAGTSQMQVAQVNGEIGTRQTLAAVELAGAAASIAAGLAVLLWPASPARLDLGATTSGGWVSMHGRF